ncbi:MAG: PaaI family thioesterase [Lentisphaeria bacterium]|nr:PaaI family thioesterase [Lentisphaeria bacterium]
MDNNFYNQLKEFLNTKDHFCKENGMQILSISEGCAEAEMIVTEHHLNGMRSVQGGALFTLADFACAAAINSFGMAAVSMSASVSFIRPGINMKRMTAVAKLVNKGKTTTVLDVDVIGENGKVLLHSMMTGHLSDKPLSDFF